MTVRRGARRLILFSLGAALVVLVAAFVSIGWDVTRSPSPARGGGAILRVGWLTDPSGVNPFSSAFGAEIFSLNYDMLTRWDPVTLLPKPALAASWSHSQDGRVWTFRLRKGVQWQDGQPLTAADVVFTFRCITRYQLANYIGYLKYIDRVVAVDRKTVRFYCSRPKANILTMAVPIVPEHIWGQIDAAKIADYVPKLPLVGTGPFQLVGWRSDQYLRMVANRGYWRGAPKVAEVVFVTYQNADVMADDLLSGTIQAAVNLPEPACPRVSSTPGFRVITANPFRAVDQLSFNCYSGPASRGNPVLKDPAFRRALAFAIDKETIAGVAYGGDAVPASTVIVAGYYRHPDWHWQPPPAEACRFDLVKANQLLDEAGYRRGPNGLRCFRGKPIVLRLLAGNRVPQWPVSARLIAGWLGRLGLTIKLTIMDDGAAMDRVWNYSGSRFAPDFDLFMWGSSGAPDPDDVLASFTAGQIAIWNTCGWSNAAYDRLYDEQGATINPLARSQVIWKMQQVMNREEPAVMLVEPQMPIAYNVGSWTGWVRAPAGTGQAIYTAYFQDSYLAVHPAATHLAANSRPRRPAMAMVFGALGIMVAALLMHRRRRRAVEET